MSTASDARSMSRYPRLDYRIFLWGVSGIWLAILTAGVVLQGGQIRAQATSLLPWVALLSIVHLLPVEGWHSAQLVADWPIETAVALVLAPVPTGIVGFVSAFDTREFRGQISLAKAVFNRSQVGLTYFLASSVAHRVAFSPDSSTLILPIAFLVLGVAVCTNYVIVGLEISLEHHVGFGQALQRLRLGTATDLILTFAGWSVLGAMLAALYTRIHPAALLAFLAPTLLGRQVLMRSQMFVDTSEAYQSRGKAMAKLEHQISEERSDERRLIAADLHDEVLQPLFKVTLMAHVLKTDLASGRLLDMDADLPELIAAAETASTTLRDLIGDLRRSTLGAGGLVAALERLIQTTEAQTPIRIHREIAPVAVAAATELIIYQVAKEALGNSVSHARASAISLKLAQDIDLVLLEVQDDGIGFDPLAQREGHYGLHIMKERAGAVGGSLFVDSAPGNGCSVRLVLHAVIAFGQETQQN